MCASWKSVLQWWLEKQSGWNCLVSQRIRSRPMRHVEWSLPGWHASCCRTGAALTRLSTWHLTPLRQTPAISQQPALPYSSHWANHCFGLGAGTTLVRSSWTRFSQTWRWSHHARQRLTCPHVWERNGTCYHKNPAANGPATFLATPSNHSWAIYMLNL